MKVKSPIGELIDELNLDSLCKTSHKNQDMKKELITHITDIKSISEVLAKKHNLVDFLDIIDILAENHDTGKLNPLWNVDNDWRPPHSPLSAYLFLKYLNVEDPRFFYFLLKHHSNLMELKPTISSARKNIVGRIKFEIDKKEAENLVYEEIKKLGKRVKQDVKSNVILTDLFGVFKSGDIISAMFEEKNEIFKQNLDFGIEPVKGKLKDYVKSKNLEFDENKWVIFNEMAKSRENIIFLAPTGWGKTFAALTIALKRNPSNIIFVLPTITSIRKMRKSIQDLLDSINVEENYFFADVEKIGRVDNLQDITIELDLFVSKSFMSPVTITTLDQLLLTFLQVGKYFLKRFHFRNSVLIFDEFHLYPINGLYILLYFLEKFNKDFEYNMKAIFMSATIHPYFQGIINQFITPEKFEFLQEYEKKRRYIYTMEKNDITDENSIREIISKSTNGNVLVVCNTVEKAIRAYVFLNRYKKGEVLLLHSRYTYSDRREREEWLEELFRSCKPFIFVSTQVAEVSLDISFNYLFSELAPIPSLIQRFGRVNRYSDSTDSTNVTITYPKEIGKSKSYPYDETELIFAFNVLCELEGKINSEIELIKRLESAPISIDDIELNEIGKYLKRWEEDTKYFYRVDLNKEELNKFLKFRETNTALIIPDCFREKILEIIHSEEIFKSQSIKRYFVPVPIWWLLEDPKCIHREENLLFLSNPRFCYSRDVGYFDRERLSDLLGALIMNIGSISFQPISS